MLNPLIDPTKQKRRTILLLLLLPSMPLLPSMHCSCCCCCCCCCCCPACPCCYQSSSPYFHWRWWMLLLDTPSAQAFACRAAPAADATGSRLLHAAAAATWLTLAWIHDVEIDHNIEYSGDCILMEFYKSRLTQPATSAAGIWPNPHSVNTSIYIHRWRSINTESFKSSLCGKLRFKFCILKSLQYPAIHYEWIDNCLKVTTWDKSRNGSIPNFRLVVYPVQLGSSQLTRVFIFYLFDSST